MCRRMEDIGDDIKYCYNRLNDNKDDLKNIYDKKIVPYEDKDDEYSNKAIDVITSNFSLGRLVN